MGNAVAKEQSVDTRLSIAMEQTIGALKSQANMQARLLEEKDRQILELHALLRDAMRRPTLALPAPSGGAMKAARVEARPWWRRLLGL